MNNIDADTMRGGRQWILTFTGRQFYPLDPRWRDVDVLDIAHALAMKCRYSGHSSEFYSVAQHAVLVSRAVFAREPQHAMWALHHDDSEAYLPDVARPIKPHLAGFKELEGRVMEAVCAKFGLLPLEEPAVVKQMDTAILWDEMAQLMGAKDLMRSDALRSGRLGIEIEPWPWQKAEAEFLRRHIELGGEI